MPRHEGREKGREKTQTLRPKKKKEALRQMGIKTVGGASNVKGKTRQHSV